MAKGRNLLRAVRRNRDYQAVMAWAEKQGLEATLCPPKGKGGHPYIVITDGVTSTKKMIAASPAPNLNTGPVVQNVRRLWNTALERDGRLKERTA